MKRIAIVMAAICLAMASAARGDTATSSAQQKLKDQGFYYGEVTGRTDADTTAAIRRYQIRNGLKITGDLNAETLKSLGVRGSASGSTPTAPAAKPTPARSATPRPVPPAPRPVPQEDYDGSDLRAEPNEEQEYEDDAPTTRGRTYSMDPREPGYGLGPRQYAPRRFGVFDGTPYEIAPAEVQRDVIARAQSIFLRQGLYRSDIDGIFGPGTQYALRAYQARAGLEPTGAFDMETLGSLDLLPRRRRGFERRLSPPALIRELFGERIYTPRPR
jgi:peptidoglycan hydrolase-like protein with peptidoglycan-binding domain